MEVKKYDKIVLDSTRSIDDIAAGIKAELSKQESENAGESYICYVSHAYSSGDNAGVSYIVVSDGFKELKRLSSNVIKASSYTKDEINELIARVEAKIPVDEANLATKEEVNEINSTLTDAINTINAKANTDAVVNLSDNQTIAGVKTFSSVPVVASPPTDDNQVANKAYVDSRASTADISRASWGVNWNAPIPISPRIIMGFEEPFEIPDDGVIFLWGGDFLNFNYNPDVRTKFQILPKNYTALSRENIEGFQVPQYPQFARLFAKSAQDKTETIGKENAGVFFAYGQTDHGNLSSMTNYPYTTTLSFIPVRQGDKVFLQDIGGNDVGLNGIFFPFER